MDHLYLVESQVRFSRVRPDLLRDKATAGQAYREGYMATVLEGGRSI